MSTSSPHLFPGLSLLFKNVSEIINCNLELSDKKIKKIDVSLISAPNQRSKKQKNQKQNLGKFDVQKLEKLRQLVQCTQLSIF